MQIEAANDRLNLVSFGMEWADRILILQTQLMFDWQTKQHSKNMSMDSYCYR